MSEGTQLTSAEAEACRDLFGNIKNYLTNMEKVISALASRVEMLEEELHYGTVEDEPLEAAHQEFVAELRNRRSAGLA